MKDEKPTFRRFLDRQEAQDLSERLQEAGFDASFHDNSSFHDPIFVGTNTAWFHVLLPPEEFDRANELLQLEAREQLAELPDDHYLHGFTDQELRDILLRQDQWSAEDVIRARHVLSTRGDPISEEAVTRLREARIEELRLPAPSQAPLIIMGWFFTLLGGLVGIGIGLVPQHGEEDPAQRGARSGPPTGGQAARGTHGALGWAYPAGLPHGTYHPNRQPMSGTQAGINPAPRSIPSRKPRCVCGKGGTAAHKGRP